MHLVPHEGGSSGLMRQRGQAGPGRDAGFAEGVPQVRSHGHPRNEQVLGDLPAGQAVRGQPGHSPLGAGQCVVPRTACTAAAPVRHDAIDGFCTPSARQSAAAAAAAAAR
jgi:hypothetical protein